MNPAAVMLKLARATFRSLGERRPRTPIRWLCLKSFSYLGEVQNRTLAGPRFDTLNQALELGVYLNRCFDRKHPFRAREYRELRRKLPPVATRYYLNELKGLEQSRPTNEDWNSILFYRRSVLNVSLNYLFELSRLDRRAVLLPLVSLVQLADDVLDSRIDQALGLPTFMASGGPHPRALADDFWSELLNHQAPEDRPFLFAGWLVYLFTRVLIFWHG